MGAFSIEFEQGLLERVDKLANKKLELERQLQNKTGLISAKELKNELDISGTTYFRVSDVIKFLTVY